MSQVWSRRKLVALFALPALSSLAGACAPAAQRVGSVDPTPTGPAQAPNAPPARTPPAEPTVAPTVAPTPSPVAEPAARTASPAPTIPTAPTAAPTRPVTSTPTPIAKESVVDRTTMLVKHGPAEIAAGVLDAVSSASGQVVLARSGGGYAGAGSVTSTPVNTAFPFDTLVPSWNALTPAGTGVQLDLRVRQGDAWSAWYVLGRWGGTGSGSVAGQKDATGEVDVDTLKLGAPAHAFQYRVRLSTSDPQQTPALRLVAVNYADLRQGLKGPKLKLSTGWAKELPVPVQSQVLQDPSYALEVCSPTSLTMVLQYWGVKKEVSEVVKGVRDTTAGIYGNWPFNTAFAAAQGLEAYVDRFYSIDQLQEEIVAGRPVIVSVKYKAGELDNSPIRSTTGHLFVVRGFTPAGDVVANDPIAPTLTGVRRVYKRDQFANVWIRHGGIVYLVRPRNS
ncbi:MAG: C39 family peptidase [Chloroflexi bacterium]|nr:C39 family peptidase [Chloroflexota bacterium]